MNKYERAKEAQRTIVVSNQGFYNFGDEKIFLASKKNSELWKVDDMNMLLGKLTVKNTYDSTKVIAKNESTVDTIFSLQKANVEGSSVGILNFSSAYNPSGGFINSSMAQEEDLAYASDLYYTPTTSKTQQSML